MLFSCNFPQISGNNDLFRDRGDGTVTYTAWSSPTVASSGGWTTVTKTGGSSLIGITKSISLPTKDWVLVAKVKANRLADDSQSIQLYNPNGTNKFITFWLNNDQVSQTKVLDTVSVCGYKGSTRNAKVLTTTHNSTNELHFRLWYDSKYSCLWCQFRENSEWVLKGRIECDNIAGAELRVTLGGIASVGSWIAFDDILIGRPNIILCGDSAGNGNPHFSTDPTAGLNDFDSTFLRHLDPWSYLENSFIAPKCVNGNGSQAMRDRFIADAIDNKPPCVMIQGPGNDYNLGVSHATRAANFQWMIDQALAIKAHVILLSNNNGTPTNPSQPQLRDYWRTWWNDYVPLLRGPCTWIDLMEPVKDANNYVDPQWIIPGDTHFASAAYALVSQYIQAQA